MHPQRAALEEQLATYPEARPSLAEVALALAELEHSPLAQRPYLIERGAEEILRTRPGVGGPTALTSR